MLRDGYGRGSRSRAGGAESPEGPRIAPRSDLERGRSTQLEGNTAALTTTLHADESNGVSKVHRRENELEGVRQNACLVSLRSPLGSPVASDTGAKGTVARLRRGGRNGGAG